MGGYALDFSGSLLSLVGWRWGQVTESGGAGNRDKDSCERVNWGKDGAGDHGGGGQEEQAPCSLTDKLDGSHTAVYGILRLKARMEG